MCPTRSQSGVIHTFERVYSLKERVHPHLRAGVLARGTSPFTPSSGCTRSRNESIHTLELLYSIPERVGELPGVVRSRLCVNGPRLLVVQPHPGSGRLTPGCGAITT